MLRTVGSSEALLTYRGYSVLHLRRQFCQKNLSTCQEMNSWYSSL